jgi:hypothetical protein
VIPDREYEIESLPLYQEDMVTKSISSEGNLSEDFAASRQTQIKSMPSDDNFGDDFVYTRKAKGKKSVPGKSLVHVYTYQVNGIRKFVPKILFQLMTESDNSILIDSKKIVLLS